MYMKRVDLTKLTAVKPHARQLLWQKMEYYNFIDFGMGTFSGKDSGDGTVPPSKFKLKEANVEEWVRIAKLSGSSGIVFTVKHHDGFCMFDTKHTDYNIMQSPYGKDMVAELATACRKFDMKFGIALSLIDRNNASYGSASYNDYFVNLLTELLLGYGNICGIWLDMTAPDSKQDKAQQYDFDRYFATIRKLQSNTIIAMCGADVRWHGLPEGAKRLQEWSVVNSQCTQYGISKSTQNKVAEKGDLTALDLGSRDLALQAKELVWCPAECHTSILNSGLYHSTAREMIHGIKTVAQLRNVYYNTVGNNVNWALSVPITKAGIVSPKIADRLKEFGNSIAKDFEKQVDARIIQYNNPKGQTVFDIKPNGNNITIFKLKEDIANGQLVEEFWLQGETADKSLIMLDSGNTIGASKIITIKKQEFTKFRLTIIKSRADIKNLSIMLF